MRTNCCAIQVPLTIVMLPALVAPATGVHATNATPTEQSGLYLVMPVLKQMTGVHVVPLAADSKAEKRVLERKDCKYDPKTGKLEIKVPIDDKSEMVCVLGDPVVPWAGHLLAQLDQFQNVGQCPSSTYGDWWRKVVTTSERLGPRCRVAGDAEA